MVIFFTVRVLDKLNNVNLFLRNCSYHAGFWTITELNWVSASKICEIVLDTFVLNVAKVAYRS